MSPLGKSDVVLIREIKQNNKHAFETLFRKYYPQLCNFAAGYGVKDVTAEDIVQDVFIKFWENRHELLHGRNIRSYLFLITRNEALNHIKHHSVKQKAFKEIAVDLKNTTQAPVEFDNRAVEQLKKELEKAFETLPPRCKEIFLLSRDNGLTYKEIATVLGISVKTVETQMGRTLQKLRIYLADFLALFIGFSLLIAG